MKILSLCMLCLLTTIPLVAQPCPEITSSSISPEEGAYCPGAEVTLSWAGNNVDLSSGICWHLSQGQGNEEIIGCADNEFVYGNCVSPEILYVMADPDDDLVGSADDCHDEFIVLYIGGPRPSELWGGPVPDHVSDIRLCFDGTAEVYYGVGNCTGSSSYDFVEGNASTFNCGTPLGPNSLIPENSILVIQTSPFNNVTVDLGEICNLGLPVYIIAMNTPENCTGGFIPNTNDQCDTCTISFFPDWCNFISYCVCGGDDGYLESGFDQVTVDYILPNTPLSGWGISNSIGGGVFGNEVPDIDLPTLYTGYVTPLPVTWMIPNEFCDVNGPGMYHIVGELYGTDCEIFTEELEISIVCIEITGVPEQVCHYDPPIELPVIQGGVTGSWTGPGVEDNIFYPSGLDGVYTLTFIPDELQCGQDISITITVLALPVSWNLPNVICESDDPIDLNSVVYFISGADTIFIPGLWSGPGVSNNIFDPTGLSGYIWLTFDPELIGCLIATTGQIFVSEGVVLQLEGVPAFICSEDDPIALPILQAGFTGNWSGQGVLNNMFDPQGLNGQITLTFIPDENQCVQTATTQVDILPIVVPEITGIPDTLCQAAMSLSLQTIQSNIPGSWSGQGVSNNTFNPAGLSGTIILYFTPNAGQCASVVSTHIDVVPAIDILITEIPVSLCQNDNAVPLATTQSGIPGNWSGQGVSNNQFNPSGLSGNIELTFTPDPDLCAETVTTIIYVDPAAVPMISGIPSALCQSDASIILPAIQNNITGNWSGAGIVNNTFNPAGLYGLIFLVFTPDAGQCAGEAQHGITVNIPFIPIITGIPSGICEDAPLLLLSTTQNGIIGNWSGQGVISNTFNPTGLIGTIELTFVPDADQCALVAATTINVGDLFVPEISGIPASLCEGAGSIILQNIQDGIIGNWSGEGVTNNILNPSGLAGTVSLYFVPDTDECIATAQTDITITPIIIPTLEGVPTSLCEMDDVVNLLTEFDNISGNWSGPGISANMFNPNGQNGFVTITFTPDPDQCSEVASTTIEVLQPFEPEISGIPLSLCEQDDPVLLENIQGGISGTWSGAGVANSILNPSGQNGVLTISFTPDDGQCAGMTSMQIEVNSPPAFINLVAVCDSISQSYLVSFDIIGGDSTGYSVNGNPLTGTHFVSMSIDALITEYSFLLDDSKGCGPVTINGMLDCACATSAGNMDISGNAVNVCEGSEFTVQYFNNGSLDPDDLLRFVLHDQAGSQLGTILAISSTPTFSTPSGIITGQTYYVSAIAGTDNGNGEIDLADACLSVSQGVPVIFYRPEIQLGDATKVCYPECFSYIIQFQGEAPYAFTYEILTNDTSYSFTQLANENSDSIVLCPADFNLGSGNLTLIPLMISDANCSFPLDTLSGLTSIVHGPTASSLYRELCTGESISIHGYVFDQSNPQGSVVIAEANQFGCDSIIEVNLSYREPSYHEIKRTLCYGTSVFINGTEYTEENPSGTEILPGGNQFGCDSIIQIDLTFSSFATGEYITTLCNDVSVTINGTTYNQSNPSGTELFPGGSASGCDSLVNINLSFYPRASSDLSASLCNGEFLVINGTIYDLANSTGVEVMQASSIHGCDSVINISLTFYPDMYSSVVDTLHAGDYLIVNGNIYDQTNPSGVEIIPGGSSSGCDSIIEVSLHFVQALTVLFQAIAPECDGDSTGLINLEEIAGGTLPYLISVDGADPIVVSAWPLLLTGFMAGAHILHIEDANLNSLDIEVNIPEAPILAVDAGMDQSIQHGDNAQLSAAANFDVVYWNWSPTNFLSCTDCPDPLAEKPDESIHYKVTATDQHGCASTDLVIVEVTSKVTYYTPSIFSPNGDQINDTWFISSNDPDAMITSMSIYDRWGDILYTSSFQPVNTSEAGWDGTSRGQRLEPGVYVFVAELTNQNGKSEHLFGDITLIR